MTIPTQDQQAQPVPDVGFQAQVKAAIAPDITVLESKLDAVLVLLRTPMPPPVVPPVVPPLVPPPVVQPDPPPIIVVTPPPVPPIVPPPGMIGAAKLLQSADMVYQGSFRVPASGFGYALASVAYDPANNSLFMMSQTGIAEISIPGHSTNLAALERATLLQAGADITEGNVANIGAGGARVDNVSGNLIGGILVDGDDLIMSAYGYYDSTWSAKRSHGRHSKRVAQRGTFRGMCTVAPQVSQGIVAGAMAHIPPAWQPLFGGTALTGQSCLSIIGRTSYGPSAFAFNPSDVGVIDPVPASGLVYYDEGHQNLGPWINDSNKNPLFNMNTQGLSMVFPVGSRSVLFIGKTDLGIPCYGPNTGNPAAHRTDAGFGQHYCYDQLGPDAQWTGPHCTECTIFIWAYDAVDLLAVKNGQKQPWDVRPYAAWTIAPLASLGPEISFDIQGVGYDAARQLLYVSQRTADHKLPGGDGSNPAPVVHVYKLGL